jgi:VWFA-related protein
MAKCAEEKYNRSYPIEDPRPTGTKSGGIMKKFLTFALSFVFIAGTCLGQNPQKPPQEIAPEDVIRITTNLVQTDAVITDKNDQIIKDLKMGDFELYDNGKRQDLKFMEYVGVDTAKRIEGTLPELPNGAKVESLSNGTSAADLKRVIAFVVDDLTIPADDLSRVRTMLLDFVNNKMVPGDLVSIVSVVGGSGLLQQYSSDKDLLRRAISHLTPKTHPMSANNSGFNPADATPAAADAQSTNQDVAFTPDEGLSAESLTADTNTGFRVIMGLTTTDAVITSLKPIPGRKSVVLISGGLPLYEASEQGVVMDPTTQEKLPVTEVRPLFGDISGLINEITDNASRSGVVVNTMDVRGLQVRPGIRGFQDTEAKSALGMSAGSQTIGGGGMDPTFGRAPNAALIASGDSVSGAQGLRTLANATGGIAATNTNNFRDGLQKVLAHSQGYYLLGYSPTEKFDAKFHKVTIKVRRDGARVYTREGYLAREESPVPAETTKEDSVLRAVMSPLVKTELGVSTLVQHKFLPSQKAELDIHMLVDPKTLHFTQSPDGHYQDSFDIAGFVFNQRGKRVGGFSETINSNLTPEQYKKALSSGISDSAHTELPPGYFQLRVVVRENETGRVGTTSKYLEVPDLSKKALTMSSMFLFAVEANQTDSKGAIPLQNPREISRKKDLRYAAVIYNPRIAEGKPQLKTQLFITQGSKVLLQNPAEPFAGPTTGIQAVKIGQLGLSKVPPGHYILTLVTTDPLAEKKQVRSISRSIDFTVVE